MTRVLHVMAVDARDGVTAVSGAERHLEDLVSVLSGDGVDVGVLLLARSGAGAGAGGSAPGDELDWAAVLRDRGATVWTIHQGAPGGSLAKRVARMRTVPAIVARIRAWRPDIVHTHLLYASQVGRVAAWVARAPAIVESFHNDEPFLGDRSWRVRLRALARITTQHIAISDAVKTRLVRDVGLAPEAVTVVRYGVPDERGTLDRDAARAELGIGQEECVVGFVGRLTRQKRVDVLIDAAPLLQNASCVLVGDGELRSELEARAAQIDARVRFAGHVPDAPAVMRAFDVFCLPSDWEGLGLVLVEAMLRGVPVAGAMSGAIPEVLDQGRAGALFPPRDPAALARVVNELLDDPERRGVMAREGRAFALAAFAPERMLAETQQVYEEALRRSRRSRA